MFQHERADAEELLRHADAAMLASKRERRPTTGRRH
jgi:GGDEF domain-containing protein